MDITQKFNEWCSKNLPLSAPGKEVEASDKMLEFFQSEITAAEQRGRNEVLEEIEKELLVTLDENVLYDKKNLQSLVSATVKNSFRVGFNTALSEVKSIISSHKYGAR